MIPIQNIYFLLCYAWDTLVEGKIVQVNQEACTSCAELFARVLESGVTHLLKRGLDRGYIAESDATHSLRGKFDVSSTVKHSLLQTARVQCQVDSLSHDVLHNRIIKTTLGRLGRCDDLDIVLRKTLLGLSRRLHDITEVELCQGIYSRVTLHRNNAFYGFLLHVCRLVNDSLLIDQKTGSSRFRDFVRDETKMARVFERFIVNFYRREQSEFWVKSDVLKWQDVDASDEHLRFLPSMRTDVSLESRQRYIVIDAKYYTNTLQSYWSNETVHSGNLYQMFAYLKNLQLAKGILRPIEGVLLYPTVSKAIDLDYRIHGQRIRVATVDLNADWKQITARLLGIIASGAAARVEVIA